MENENQELNQEEAQNQEERTYSASEYEDLKKQLDAANEQIKASSKEAQKLSWISKVAVDNTKFIKLYKSDKRQAEEVAKHFWRTAKELYDQVASEYGDNADNWLDIEDVDARAEAIANKKFAQQSLKSFKEKYWIEWKLEKTFDSEFDSLMSWKDWESEEVIKQAKRALKLCKDTDEFQAALNKENSRLAWAWITWSTRSDKGERKESSPYSQWKEQEAKQSIFWQYGKSKDF